MNNLLFDLSDLRFEISFKSYDELRLILSFFENNNLYNINIPCKNNLKKNFLLNSIKISREEFPTIDLIPHFSILHEFKRNRFNTQTSFKEFLQVVKYLGCNEVLIVSGSQKRSTLDSVSILHTFKDNTLFSNCHFSLGVAFNPYLPEDSFQEEIRRLEEKLKSNLVTSIWLQFGSDVQLLTSRIEILKKIIFLNNNSDVSRITLFGSIFIPSNQFLARFKYRPWKGVFLSSEFLESIDFANEAVMNLFKTYKYFRISPIIESNISNQSQLNSLCRLLET
tara:strand:- start:262 stop:1101 length:840 start_codon:yes stop_codon:yes gene_type:complete